MDAIAHYLSLTADILGISGFFLAIWTLRVARSVKKTQDSFVSRSRGPAVLDDLSAENSALAKLLGSPASTELNNRIATIEALLQALLDKVPRHIQTDVKFALSLVQSRQPMHDEEVDSLIHAKVHKICISGRNHFQDEQIRGAA